MSLIVRLGIIALVYTATMTQLSSAQGTIGIFINPGVKIGYAFGKSPGFVWGIETSFGAANWSRGDLAGIVCGFSRGFGQSGDRNIYFEVEYGNLWIGGSLGLAVNTTTEIINPYARLYGGLFGYLSFRYPFGELPKELSIVGKLPICLINPPNLN